MIGISFAVDEDTAIEIAIVAVMATLFAASEIHRQRSGIAGETRFVSEWVRLREVVGDQWVRRWRWRLRRAWAWNATVLGFLVAVVVAWITSVPSWLLLIVPMFFGSIAQLVAQFWEGALIEQGRQLVRDAS